MCLYLPQVSGIQKTILQTGKLPSQTDCVLPKGPDDVLIKLNATGICYSDIHYMLNDLPLPPMSTFGVKSPGHEGAGVVVAVGSNVRNWKVGDRAGIKPAYDACFNCELCWTGKETYCEESPQIGLQFPGSYQQYLLSPARYTQRSKTVPIQNHLEIDPTFDLL